MEKFSSFHIVTQEFGQLISIKKTEVMVVSRKGEVGMKEEEPNIIIDEIPLNKVNRFNMSGESNSIPLCLTRI